MDLKTLEGQPLENISYILMNLDPKSLIQVCATSKRLRSACKVPGVWKTLFRRDISTRKMCQAPNWEKLYRLAVTGHLNVYKVIDIDTDGHRNLPDYAIGIEDLEDTISASFDEDDEFPYDKLKALFPKMRKDLSKKRAVLDIAQLNTQSETSKIEIKIVGKESLRYLLSIPEDKYMSYIYKLTFLKNKKVSNKYIVLDIAGKLKELGYSNILSDVEKHENDLEDYIFTVSDDTKFHVDIISGVPDYRMDDIIKQMCHMK